MARIYIDPDASTKGKKTGQEENEIGRRGVIEAAGRFMERWEKEETDKTRRCHAAEEKGMACMSQQNKQFGMGSCCLGHYFRGGKSPSILTSHHTREPWTGE